MRSGPPATPQQLETAWATNVIHRSSGSVSIQMASKGFIDDMVKRWSEWFKTNLSMLAGGNRKAAGVEVNFSENEITSIGLSHLFGVFQEIGMTVSTLKLHKNMIESEDALVELLKWKPGRLTELHLSHNRLDTTAAKNIIVAAVFATDEQHAPKYPGRGGTPLWLRLENNDRINVKGLGQELKVALGRKGKTIRKTICEVDGWTACNTGQCVCHATPPAIHLTYLKLFNQLAAGDASGPSVHVQQVGGRQKKGIAHGTSQPATPARGGTLLSGHTEQLTFDSASAEDFPALSEICTESIPRSASAKAKAKAARDRRVEKRASGRKSNVAVGTTELPGPRPGVVVCDYEAESSGYLSVRKGQHANVWWEHIELGDSCCQWSHYTFGDVGDNEGWLPVPIVWPLYVDDNGRPWIQDSTTGTSKWLEHL